MTRCVDTAVQLIEWASMRPGQEAPDDRQPGDHGNQETTGFNEAGARSPG